MSRHRNGAPPGHPCLWPIGDPALPDFRFCGAPRVLDRPYCAEHVALAYSKVSKRPLTGSGRASARQRQIR
jgi:hypothetical protein